MIQRIAGMGRTLTEQVPTVRCDALSLRLDLIPAAVALHSGPSLDPVIYLAVQLCTSHPIAVLRVLEIRTLLGSRDALPSAPCWAEVQRRVF